MSAYTQKIMALLKSGQAREAVPLCDQYCREQPGQAEAWFLRAGVLAQLGVLDEVVSCCRKVVELAPGHVGAWFNLGVALQSLGSWQAAADAYVHAISLNPAYPSPYANITVVLRRLGRMSEALKYAHEAVRLDPAQPTAISNLGLVLLDSGDYAAALQQFDKAITLNPAATGPLLNKGLTLARMGEHAAASACFHAIIQRDPGNTQALIEIGNLQRRQYEFDAALATYQGVIERHPDQAETCNLIGLTMIEAGRPQAAIEWIEKAVSIRPDFADAYNTLAGARHALGDIDAAKNAFNQAVELDPRCAHAHNNLGLLLQQSGDYAAAEQHFSAAISVDPDNADFENNLGALLTTLSRFDEAVVVLRSAVAHEDRHAAAWNNLGNALLSVVTYRDNFAEADAAYLRAIDLKPDLAEAYFHYGISLQHQGEYESAFERFVDAASRRPDYIEAKAVQVIVLERIGRFAEANSILQALLAEHKDNVLVGLAFGVMARHLGQGEQALELLRSIDVQELEKWSSIQRNFVMGDLYDDSGDRDKAFAHYLAANSEDHPGYSVSQTQQLYTSLQTVYGREKQQARGRAAQRSELPVFIVGMPRSGTSLLEQILASHPDVYAAGELEDMFHLTSALPKLLNSKRPYPFCIEDAGVGAFDKIASDYLTQLQAYAPDAQRIVDKMPHNFEALGLIDRLFPGAKVLHCLRSPLDTCVSIYFKQFNSLHPYASDLRSLGLYYRQYQNLMEYWRRTLTLPILDVRYEDVVADQEGMSRKILEFIGLKWDERCLNFHQLERAVKTPSYDQVRKPIYTKSVQRWRHYEDHLGPLLEVLSD